MGLDSDSGSGPCTLDLATVGGGCNPTYTDDADAGCGAYVVSFGHGACGGFLVTRTLWASVGGAVECYYDATSQKLVGAVGHSDSQWPQCAATSRPSNVAVAGAFDATCAGLGAGQNEPQALTETQCSGEAGAGYDSGADAASE
jgi:hypothetical protein